VVSMSSSVSVSILILTKDEEQNLPACLESVSWSDDIHVYDTMSTDSTVAIAQQYGAKITQKGYEGGIAFGGDEAAHRNWGLQNIPFAHPWVLQLDADERSNPALAAEINEVIKAGSHSAYRIRRRDFLLGRWLRHVQATPYYLRLFRPDQIHYERLINPITVVHGSTGELQGYFDHYPFSKGFAEWIGKHNHYSTLEAQEIIKKRSSCGFVSLTKALTGSDFHERRYHQKEVFYRMPLRPLLRFLILYVGKRGFLDGRAGLTYATLQAIYEHFIVLKTRELERQGGWPRGEDSSPRHKLRA
jgi:glycosyltransferase involved in cell wall biosynthesis